LNVTLVARVHPGTYLAQTTPARTYYPLAALGLRLWRLWCRGRVGATLLWCFGFLVVFCFFLLCVVTHSHLGLGVCVLRLGWAGRVLVGAGCVTQVNAFAACFLGYKILFWPLLLLLFFISFGVSGLGVCAFG
jgi:hypothetical protein